MKNKKTIEDILCKNRNVLKTKRGLVTAEILDAELDVINCRFNYDECVEIDTENLTYITLTVDNLETLIELIQESETFYRNQK